MKTYTADRELAMLLKAAESSGEPLRVVTNGSTYLVQVQRASPDEGADGPATYDPQKVRDALREFAGTWSDLDADELKATLYRAREEGSHRTSNS